MEDKVLTEISSLVVNTVKLHGKRKTSSAMRHKCTANACNKQKMTNAETSICIPSETSNNSTFILNREESFAQSQAKEEPATTMKLENTNEELVIKSDPEIIDLKLEPLVKEKMNIENEIGTHTTTEARIKCKGNYLTPKALSKVNHPIYMQTHTTGKFFKCRICNYICSRKLQLVGHMRIHTEEKPFRCKICDYSCSRKWLLVQHIRTHRDEKPFKCEFCNYRASHKEVVVNHMWIHTGEKLFKCLICNYSCSLKSHLVRHIRIHTGEKPFKCEICNYNASQKSSLDRHMKTHTGEKPFKCKICNYASSRKAYLEGHMRTHTVEKSLV